LQTNASLTATNNWIAYTGPVTNNGVTMTVTLPARPGNLYFRLKK
jgi:hypothetical protein